MSVAEVPVGASGGEISQPRARGARHRAMTWSLLIWLGYLLLIAVFAAAGSELAPYDPTAQNVVARLSPPWSSSGRGFHWLGTDQLGRDVLSNMIVATRLTLFIGLVSTFAGLVIGVALGMMAGYYGGGVDRLIMRLTEAQTAMPMF